MSCRFFYLGEIYFAPEALCEVLSPFVENMTFLSDKVGVAAFGERGFATAA
jgi:hypothetical protein